MELQPIFKQLPCFQREQFCQRHHQVVAMLTLILSVNGTQVALARWSDIRGNGGVRLAVFVTLLGSYCGCFYCLKCVALPSGEYHKQTVGMDVVAIATVQTVSLVHNLCRVTKCYIFSQIIVESRHHLNNRFPR